MLGLRRALLAAIVAGVALSAPAAAFACDGGPSAVSVYKECVPSGTGAKPTGGGQSTSGAGKASKQLRVSHRTTKALHRAGKDQKILSNLVKNPAYGTRHLSHVSSSGPVAAPSALGSAVDLGSGPIVLLAALAGSALLLLAASGRRAWRRWRRV